MILSNDGLVAFHYRSYGTFFLQQNRLHNSYGGSTHYRNYRAYIFGSFGYILWLDTSLPKRVHKIILTSIDSISE